MFYIKTNESLIYWLNPLVDETQGGREREGGGGQYLKNNYKIHKLKKKMMEIIYKLGHIHKK